MAKKNLATGMNNSSAVAVEKIVGAYEDIDGLELTIDKCVEHVKNVGLRIIRPTKSKDVENVEIKALEKYKGFYLGQELMVDRNSCYKVSGLKKTQVRYVRQELFNTMKRNGEVINLKVVFILQDPIEEVIVTFDIV